MDWNKQFNTELRQQIGGTLPENHVYQLGMPSEFLLQGGLPELPIELSAKRLENKANQKNHTFPLESVCNLPEALNNPIMVFGSTKKDSSRVRTDSRNRMIQMEVNDIKSLYPKNHLQGVVDWINSKDDLLRYTQKEKALNYLSTQSTCLIGGGEKLQGLSDAFKVIQNHKNIKGEDLRTTGSLEKKAKLPKVVKSKNQNGMSM